MRAAIPTFKLYGEQGWPTPDLLHWESVAQRSRLHDWIIKPHRHGNLVQTIYVETGSVQAQLDGRDCELTPPCLVIVPALCVHGFRFSPDVQGHVVTLALPLVEKINHAFAIPKLLPEICTLLPDSDHSLSTLFDAIADEYSARRSHRDWALETLVNRLLLWVARQNQNDQTAQDIKPNRGGNHLASFNQLVEAHYMEHRPLAWYAARLKVSLPHLNALCRTLANRSALQVIHERILLEAKRNLIYTAMSVSEIASALGFSEPAYFTRFFKRLTGVSPQAFRLKSET